jgi:cyclopropane fatty-acyl-phospholipid synthase-like methyltransferase
LPTDKKARLVDIGFGRGEMLSLWKNLGYQNYLGVDVSQEEVKYCSSLGLNCQQVNDGFAFLRDNPDSFDLVAITDVLEHIKKEKIIECLEILRASLKDGGRAIIQVPNMQAPESYLHRYNDITHEIGFVEHSLRQLFRAVEFAPEDMIFLGFEDIIGYKPQNIIRKFLRFFYFRLVTSCRIISGNLHPKILHPVIFAVITKR